MGVSPMAPDEERERLTSALIAADGIVARLAWWLGVPESEMRRRLDRAGVDVANILSRCEQAARDLAVGE